MGIDFSNMLDDDDDAVINPRDIFFTLNRQPQFSFPRDIAVIDHPKDHYATVSNISMNIYTGDT